MRWLIALVVMLAAMVVVLTGLLGFGNLGTSTPEEKFIAAFTTACVKGGMFHGDAVTPAEIERACRCTGKELSPVMQAYSGQPIEEVLAKSEVRVKWEHAAVTCMLTQG